MSGQVGIAAAFAAGLVSFLSPCVLPMVPGYLAFLAGLAKARTDPASGARSLIVSALLFVVGFSAVFVALGSTASVAGMALAPYRAIMSRLAGVLVIGFGVLMLGVIRTPGLYRELRFDSARVRGLGVWAAPAMGAAFAFGWTPCVGPILGSILMLAGSGASVSAGAGLLVAYSLGLGVPFLLFAVFIERLGPVLPWLERHASVISKTGGVVLVVFGALLLTGTMSQVTAVLSRVIPFTTG